MRYLISTVILICAFMTNGLAANNKALILKKKANDQALLREKKKDCRMAIVEKTSFYRKKLGQLQVKQKTSKDKDLAPNSEYSQLQGQKEDVQKSIDESGVTENKINELKQIHNQLKQLSTQQKASQETAGIKDEIKIIRQAIADVRKEEMENNPACVEGYAKKTKKSEK